MQPPMGAIKAVADGGAVTVIEAMVCESFCDVKQHSRPQSTKKFLMGDLIAAAARRQHHANENLIPGARPDTPPRSKFAHGNRFRPISPADFEGELLTQVVSKSDADGDGSDHDSDVDSWYGISDTILVRGEMVWSPLPPLDFRWGAKDVVSDVSRCLTQ